MGSERKYSILYFDEQEERTRWFAGVFSNTFTIEVATTLSEVLKLLKQHTYHALVAADGPEDIGVLLLHLMVRDYPSIMRFYVCSECSTDTLIAVLNKGKVSAIFKDTTSEDDIRETMISFLNSHENARIAHSNTEHSKQQLTMSLFRIDQLEKKIDQVSRYKNTLDNNCVSCIIQNSFDFVAQYTIDSEVVACNEKYEQFVVQYFAGSNPERILNKVLFEQKIKEVIRRNAVLRFSTSWDLNGREISVDWTVKPFCDTSGMVTSVIAQGRDLTHIQELSREVKTLHKKNEESDKLKNAFLTNISHEIRTPVHNILGFIDVLIAENLTREDKTLYSGIIKSNCTILLKLLNDIVDISKIEAGVVEMLLQECEVNTVMLDMLARYHDVAREKHLTFEIDSQQDGLFIIRADEHKIRQVLINILDNAFKFTSKGGVSFGYQIFDTYIVFNVTDTGSGIAPDKYDFVFQHFRQIEFSYSRNYEGAGLGLAISKAFVELHGGRMWFESEEGTGTTFYFSIPLGNTTVLMV